MTEALQSALGYMFASLAAKLVYGECAANNRASARVMQKNGMKLVGQWDELDTITGASELHERYAVEVEEWRQLHAQAMQPGSKGDQ